MNGEPPESREARAQQEFVDALKGTFRHPNRRGNVRITVDDTLGVRDVDVDVETPRRRTERGGATQR